MTFKGYVIYDDINEKILTVVLPTEEPTPLSWIFPKREIAEKVLFLSPIPNKGAMSVREVRVEVLENIATEETDIAKDEANVVTDEEIATEITEISQEHNEEDTV